MNEEKPKSVKYVDKNTLVNDPPYECIVSHKIQLHHSTVATLGVFARDSIEKGELIERFPLIELDWRAKYVGDMILWRHSFHSSLECKCSDCTRFGPAIYISSGYGAVYNHQDKPNAIFQFNYKSKYVDVIALENISPDSEIFVNYGEGFNPPEGKVIVNDG